MNAKRMKKYLLAAILAALMAVLAIPAFAADAEPTTTATEPSATATEDASEGNNTPEAETLSEGPEMAFEVTTPEELFQAIEQAEDGDTIGVGCIINCMDETTLGSPDKTITILRTAPEGNVSFSSDLGTGGATIQNIIFDGGNIESVFSFVVSNIPSTFENCSFINCSGGSGAGLYLTGQNTEISGCTFDSNSGQQGAHLRIDSGAVTITDTTFSNGASTDKAGAILNYSQQEVTLTGCVITANTAAQHGGAIWNRGEMTISQCRIDRNTANGEADDIVNEYQGNLALMDDYEALLALYASYGVTPNKWAVDTFTDDSTTKANMVFSMTFTSGEPATPSTADSEPTSEPTSEPVTPSSTYRTHSQHSSGGNTAQKETKEEEAQEETKEITLTNGKAVLKPPEALCWVGYETAHSGSAEAVTRAELAALMVSLMDVDSLTEYTTTATPFDDVGDSSTLATAIGTANRAGIMVGCGNGLFCPDRPLTWGELITVFTRFTDEETPPEVYTGPHWAKDAINTAISLGWLEYTEGFDPDAPVTAGEMVSFIQTVFQWASEQEN